MQHLLIAGFGEFHRGLMATSMAEIMQFCQRGIIDYTFLGGAQIDAYGNLNSTMTNDDPCCCLPSRDQEGWIRS